MKTFLCTFGTRTKELFFLLSFFFIAVFFTSAQTLTISTSATSNGTWSASAPHVFTVTNAANPVSIINTEINTRLATGNVTISVGGNITLSAAISNSASTSVTAYTLSITSTGGSITTSAGISLTPALLVANGGLPGNNLTLSAFSDISIGSAITTTAGTPSSAGGSTGPGAKGGDVSITAGGSLNISLDITTSGTSANKNNSAGGNAGSVTMISNGSSGGIVCSNITANGGNGTGNGTNGNSGAINITTINTGETGTNAGISGVITSTPGTGGSGGGGTAGALTKFGAGTLVLSGANTYTGLTTISAGILKLGATGGAANTPLGTTGAGTVVSATGAALDLGGFTLGTAEALTLNGTGVSSGGSLMNSGAAATYSGLVTLGSASSIIGGTGTIALSNVGTITGSGFGLTLGGAQGGSITSIIGTVAGTVTKQDAGTWTLSGANTYAGATTISAGKLKLGASGVIADGSAITVTGTLDLASFSETIGSLAGGGTVTSSAAGTPVITAGGDNNSTTFSGVIQNGSATSVGLTKAGTGTLTVSGLSTYTGLTTISAGILKLGATGDATNTPLGTTGAGTSVTNGAALDLGGFTLGTAEALTLNGTGVSSGGALMNSGAAATYSGLLTLGSASSIIGGTGTITISNAGTISGATFGLTLGGAQGGTLTSILGTTSGTLTKQDAGTWTLSGANTYTGLTTISAGTLMLNNTAALGTTASGTSITSGAVLDLNGINYASAEVLTVNGTGISSGGAIVNSNATGATYAGLLTLGSASSIIGGTGTITISNAGTISGATFGLTLGGAQGGTLTSILGTTTGTLTKQDAGRWTISGANTYTGLTTISEGILKLGATGSGTNTPLGTVGSGTIVSATGAALDLGGFTLVTAEALTLNGTGVSSGGALMNSGAATTYNGAITLASGSTIGGNITFGSAGISGSQPLTVAASSSLNLGSGAVSTTDLVIGSGATLTSTSSTLTVTGNFTNNGTFTHNSGTVTLTGAAQTISGLTTFNNLTINGAGVKSVPDNITISGTMTLTSGIINVTAVLKKVIFNAGSSVSVNADKSSFIKGFVEKIGNTDFTFPVGGLVNGVNTYRPIVIAGQGGAASASTSFTAKYYEATNAISLAVSPYFKTETPGSNTLAGVSDFEYWNLTPSQLTPVMTANVTLDWSPSLYPATSTTYVSLRLAHLTGTTGNERWENLSGASGPASFASKTITVNGVSSFSPFTMGSISSAALPVTLTSFTAKPTPDNKVSLGWATSSEQVNKGFRIERQTTTETGKFEQIGFVATKAKDGNSQSVLTYYFIDNAPKLGASSFYRLVQEDLDGKLTYSDIRAVRLNGQSVSMVFPNPSNGVVNISRTADGKKMNIQVIDQSGKIVSQAFNITDANYTMGILQSGIYSIKLMYPETGEQSIQRIVVQR